MKYPDPTVRCGQAPATIHVAPPQIIAMRDRPTLAERLAASHAEHRAAVLEVERLGRMCDLLWLCIILLILVCAWLGYTAGKWEQRATSAGWSEVGR